MKHIFIIFVLVLGVCLVASPSTCYSKATVTLKSDHMKEIWKNVVDYEGCYEVSNLGRVRSVNRYVNHNAGGKRLMKGKILKQFKRINGYNTVALSNSKGITVLVHRIIAEAFICNIDNKREVNHIDCNKRNNIVTNLEWVTSSENKLHAYRNGIPFGWRANKKHYGTL